MKKLASCIFLGLIFASIVCATSLTGQKIYPINSEVYEAITYLYISQGMALPSTSGPWSGDELSRMLEKIDESRLDKSYSDIYQFAKNKLAAPARTVRFGLDASVETYIHTNTTDFVDEEDWVVGFDERKPFLDIILETFPHDNIYGYSSLSLGNVC